MSRERSTDLDLRGSELFFCAATLLLIACSRPPPPPPTFCEHLEHHGLQESRLIQVPIQRHVFATFDEDAPPNSVLGNFTQSYGEDDTTIERVESIAVGPDDTIYIAGMVSGRFLGTIPFLDGAQDWFVAAFSSDGTARWTVRFAPEQPDVGGGFLGVSPSGHLMAALFTSASPGFAHVRFVRLSPDNGTVIWSRTLTGDMGDASGSREWYAPGAWALDADGNVYYAFSKCFDGTIDLDSEFLLRTLPDQKNAVVIRLSASGESTLVASFDGNPWAIAVDDDKRILVASETHPVSTVTVFDANGRHLATRVLEAGDEPMDFYDWIQTDFDHIVLVQSNYDESKGADERVLVCLDGSGEVRWRRAQPEVGHTARPMNGCSVAFLADSQVLIVPDDGGDVRRIPLIGTFGARAMAITARRDAAYVVGVDGMMDETTASRLVLQRVSLNEISRSRGSDR